MKLNEKEIQILHFISEVKVATREQINKRVPMGSVSYQNMLLKRLERCLRHVSFGKQYVYSLNKLGCKIVGIEPYRIPVYLEHALLLTDFMLHIGKEMQIEKKITWSDKVYIPDAFYFVGPVPHLVEVDISQKMNVNLKKMDLFKEFSEMYYKQKKIRPILQFISVIESRMKKLKEAAEERALHVETFTHSEIIGGNRNE